MRAHEAIMKKMLSFVLLFAFTWSSPVQAADIEDLDKESEEEANKKSNKKTKKERRDRVAQLEKEIVREVERGFFIKTGIGTASYLDKYAAGPSWPALIRPGTVLAVSFGNDFLDLEKSSMAWEVSFYQGVHNGLRYDEQAYYDVDSTAPDRLVQGDTHTFGLLAGGEYSLYPTRRIGIGFRAFGGVIFAPVLMWRESYELDVVSGTWGQSFAPGIHEQPHPIFGGGPTLEYYTKLSHFSIGADLDITYTLGLDLGFTGAGYFKYSF